MLQKADIIGITYMLYTDNLCYKIYIQYMTFI